MEVIYVKKGGVNARTRVVVLPLQLGQRIKNKCVAFPDGRGWSTQAAW